jgi:hypothetical protein
MRSGYRRWACVTSGFVRGVALASLRLIVGHSVSDPTPDTQHLPPKTLQTLCMPPPGGGCGWFLPGNHSASLRGLLPLI